MSTTPPENRPTGLPSHPDTDDHAYVEGTNVNWAIVAAVVIVGVLFVVIVILHLTGLVGPVGHG